jgi:hypothetical protein
MSGEHTADGVGIRGRGRGFRNDNDDCAASKELLMTKDYCVRASTMDG